MAFDDDLADRVRVLLGKRSVTEQRMFGGLAFLIGGNMAVAASSKGGLMVRAEHEETERLLAEPGAEPMEMRGPVKGWVRVKGPVLDDDATLTVWVERGAAYASSLPPKNA